MIVRFYHTGGVIAVRAAGGGCGIGSAGDGGQQCRRSRPRPPKQTSYISTLEGLDQR